MSKFMGHTYSLMIQITFLVYKNLNIIIKRTFS